MEDTIYDHSIEAQQDALDQQLSDYEDAKNAEIDALQATLDDSESLIYASFEAVKANADIIGQEIATIAQQHGVTVSESLITAWSAGEDAIASYGEMLSAGSSVFIGNIQDVENQVWDLQNQANGTADSLSDMFATRSDELVSELTDAYYSEDNLNTATNALHDSLVTTLEGGYNISGITNALNSIKSSVDSITSSANEATTALAKVGATQSSSASTTTGTNVSTSSGSTSSSSSTSTSNKGSASGKTGSVPNKTSNSNLSKGTTSSGNTVAVYDNESNLVAMVSEATAKQMVANGQAWGTDITKRIYRYASGTRSTKGELIIKDEQGQELVLPKLSNGNYAIENEGSQILTKAQTDNIFDWSKFNPDDLVPVTMPDLFKNIVIPENVGKNNNNNVVNVEVGNLISVQGSVDSSNIKQMETIANTAVNNLVKKLNNGLKYGKV